MKRRQLLIALLLPLTLAASPALARAPSKKEKQDKIRQSAKQTLRQLYKLQPGARRAIERAKGYAVFNNFGVKILFAGGGSGSGLVVNQTDKHETFMKMAGLQVGLGFGIKKFSVVFVFQTQRAIDDFIESGWQFGGQGTLAAALDGKGGSLQGAISISPDTWMYQLTENGIALELTAKGAKYYKDDDLN